MAVDLTNTTYTFTVNKDGSVTFTAGADGASQTIVGADVSSDANLKVWLDNYRDAYIAGLQATQPQIASDITVGTQQTGS